jgi:hypothetical protein
MVNTGTPLSPSTGWVTDLSRGWAHPGPVREAMINEEINSRIISASLKRIKIYVLVINVHEKNEIDCVNNAAGSSSGLTVNIPFQDDVKIDRSFQKMKNDSEKNRKRFRYFFENGGHILCKIVIKPT